MEKYVCSAGCLFKKTSILWRCWQFQTWYHSLRATVHTRSRWRRVVESSDWRCSTEIQMTCALSVLELTVPVGTAVIGRCASVAITCTFPVKQSQYFKRPSCHHPWFSSSKTRSLQGMKVERIVFRTKPCPVPVTTRTISWNQLADSRLPFYFKGTCNIRECIRRVGDHSNTITEYLWLDENHHAMISWSMIISDHRWHPGVLSAWSVMKIPLARAMCCVPRYDEWTQQFAGHEYDTEAI